VHLVDRVLQRALVARGLSKGGYLGLPYLGRSANRGDVG
jgi:hypothetical protein